MNEQYKRYLGDGVYVDIDESSIVLTTENSIETTNTIYLEPEVLHSFEDYLKDLRHFERSSPDAEIEES